jgi:hypothetical protein
MYGLYTICTAYVGGRWGVPTTYYTVHIRIYSTTRLGDGGVWVAIHGRPDLPPVSTTPAANFATSTASVIDNGGK